MKVVLGLPPGGQHGLINGNSPPGAGNLHCRFCEVDLMPICKDCFYAREFGSETAVACHRWPPAITKIEGTTISSHFPLVNNDTWCGEYKPLYMVRRNLRQAIPRKESRI